MNSNQGKLILFHIAGQDHPGITSELTGLLAKEDTTIIDVGQAVIHGLLSLSILVRLDSHHDLDALLKELLFKTTKMTLKLDYEIINEEQAATKARSDAKHYALTLIAGEISAKALHEVSKCLANTKVNIDRIQRLSEGDFSCVQLMLSCTTCLEQNNLRRDLLKLARELGVDIALQPEGLFRRAKRVVVMDMDSTFIQNEVIDEFARELGVYKEVATVTESAMRGELDFNESLNQRVAKIKGLTLKQVENVYKNRIKLTPGAKDFVNVLKRLGYTVALISGGFTVIANRFKEELGLHHVFANELIFENGICTGKVKTPIVNAERKAELLEQLANDTGASLDQVVAIGDGANDLKMLAKAGLGIAFNAKPIVSEQADLSYNQKNLSSILYLIGLSGKEIREVV